MSTDLSQARRIASFKTPLGDDAFVLTRFDAREGLSELFEYRIDALSSQRSANLEPLLGEKCSVSFKLRDGSERHFSGIAAECQRLDVREQEQVYRFVLRPWLWLLSQKATCRIFHKKRAPEIICDVLDKEKGARYELRLSDDYQLMDYCVQYRESDLDFVQRLMEEHGIYYYFKHSSDGHTLVLADSRSAHDELRPSAARGGAPADGAFPFLPRGTQDQRQCEHITHWLSERRLRTGRVELNDYDYTKSGADLKRSKEEGAAKAKAYEFYDYPGRYTDRKDGERFAEIRVQAAQAQDDRRHAGGDAVSLYPGALVRVGEVPGESYKGDYLVTSARHGFSTEAYRSQAGSGEDEIYSGSYEFLPTERRFRAPLVTPRPVITGLQTAKVVGENREEGEEIDVDKYGCIYVQFHWDRDDKTTSRRVRVAQMWSGKGWGGQVIPRIGQEVVVAFLEGDPDQPLVVGTVYNDEHDLPYELPANKTVSGLKSNSTKGGGGYNELKFEDKKGEEVVTLHAQKDLASVIRHQETREIGQDLKKPTGDFARKTILKKGDDHLDIDQGCLYVTAKLKIRFKVGMSTITMDPTGVTIKSPTVTVKSTKTSVKGDATVVIKGGIVQIN